MVDPISLALTAAIAALAARLGWSEVPRPPALDGERWFKAALGALVRGRVERAGGAVEDFERDVLRWVPYHPAGRLPERKVSNPVAAHLPGAALPGEVALVEALARRSAPAGRFAWMYDEDEAAVHARLSDPQELGADYSFDRIGGTWDSLAAWGGGDPAFAEAARRVVPATWVLVEGRHERLGGPSLLPALVRELPDAVTVPWGSGPERIRELLADPGRRLVLVAEEAGVAELLRWLLADLEIRDRTLAVVAIGGVIGGRTDEPGPYSEIACRDWLGAHFGQADLDTEIVRLTPYLAVQWLDPACWPPGVPGLPLQGSRFPEPLPQGLTAVTIEAVDLGPLWRDRPPPLELVARALCAVVWGWVASRR